MATTRDNNVAVSRKRCCICKRRKAAACFCKNKRYPDGLHNVCRKCAAKASRDYYRKNKTTISARRGADWRRRQATLRERAIWYKVWDEYKITQAEYLQLLEQQGGVCAICKQPETKVNRTGRVQRLSIDHDHATGQIRGLLCHWCNFLLGHARDNLEVLQSTVTYLQEWQQRGDMRDVLRAG